MTVPIWRSAPANPTRVSWVTFSLLPCPDTFSFAFLFLSKSRLIFFSSVGTIYVIRKRLFQIFMIHDRASSRRSDLLSTIQSICHSFFFFVLKLPQKYKIKTVFSIRMHNVIV